MKRRSPKITATIHYIDQEAPPELREQALRIYALAYRRLSRKTSIKNPNQVPVPVERIVGNSENW
jgi:hypothetical protein